MPDYNPLSLEDVARPVAASVAPSAAPDELAAMNGVNTFWWTCVFGCTVEIVAGVEQPHDCEGVRVIEAALPNTLDAVQDIANIVASTAAEALKPLLRERLFDAWRDGVESGRRGLCYGVDDKASDPDEVPPLSVPRGRTHAAITLLGLSTRWFKRVEITPKKVTIEQLRVDPRGRLAVAGDEIAVATYTIDVTPDEVAR